MSSEHNLSVWLADPKGYAHLVTETIGADCIQDIFMTQLIIATSETLTLPYEEFSLRKLHYSLGKQHCQFTLNGSPIHLNIPVTYINRDIYLHTDGHKSMAAFQQNFSTWLHKAWRARDEFGIIFRGEKF